MTIDVRSFKFQAWLVIGVLFLQSEMGAALRCCNMRILTWRLFRTPYTTVSF